MQSTDTEIPLNSKITHKKPLITKSIKKPIKRISRYEKFINSHNEYITSLNEDDYNKIDKSFKVYIKKIDNYCLFKKLVKNKAHDKKVNKFIEDVEFFMELERNSLFDNSRHDKEFCKSFGFRTYFIFNIMDKIWTHEIIFLEELENIPAKDRVFLFKLVKEKFGVILNITDILVLLKQLNSLCEKNIPKRNEENLKMVARNFIKFIEKDLPLVQFKQKLEDNLGDKKYNHFFFEKNNKILIKKFAPQIRTLLLNDNYLKKKFKQFRQFFLNAKKKSISDFFEHLLKNLVKKYNKFKKEKILDAKVSDHLHDLENCFHGKTPWTINQINYALDFFEK